MSHDHVPQRHHVHRTRKQKLFLIYAIIVFYVYFTQISLSYLGLSTKLTVPVYIKICFNEILYEVCKLGYN